MTSSPPGGEGAWGVCIGGIFTPQFSTHTHTLSLSGRGNQATVYSCSISWSSSPDAGSESV